MEGVTVLQLTLVVKEDIYLLVSVSKMNNSNTSMLSERKSVGKMMDLSDR